MLLLTTTAGCVAAEVRRVSMHWLKSIFISSTEAVKENLFPKCPPASRFRVFEGVAILVLLPYTHLEFVVRAKRARHFPQTPPPLPVFRGTVTVTAVVTKAWLK